MDTPKDLLYWLPWGPSSCIPHLPPAWLGVLTHWKCVCVCQQKKYIMIHSSNGAMSTHMASVVGTGIWEHREGTLGELGGF